MIPAAHIYAWQEHAPWSDIAQVEQDLILSRAVVALFSDPALHKIHLAPAARYSAFREDVLRLLEPGGWTSHRPRRARRAAWPSCRPAGRVLQSRVIISVGDRVKSHRGAQFRIRATQRLREYVIKGFTLDAKNYLGHDELQALNRIVTGSVSSTTSCEEPGDGED